MLSFHSWVFACYINEIIPYISFCIWLLYSMSCLLDPSKARVGKLWPCHLFLKTQFHRNIAMPTCWHDFPGSSGGNEFACNAGDPGLISESGRFPGKENGNLLQYFCLENSMDRGAWWATVHGVVKSQTRLSDFTHTHTDTHLLPKSNNGS